MSTYRRVTAVPFALMLLAAACGGDSSTSDATTQPEASSAEPAEATAISEAPDGTDAPAGTDAPTATTAESGDNGGDTDVGVSATEIKMGTISDDGLVLPEIVTMPVVASVVAMFDSVNDQGGIFGRKVTVNNCDAAGDLTRFRACFKKLVETDKVFAFITSITWGTGEVHADLAKEKIPWFGSWGFFTSEWRDPWMFPTHMASIHEAHANSIWVRDVLKPKSVGILYLNIPEDKSATDEMTKIYEAAGIEVVKTIPLEIEDPNLDAHVIAMQTANPDHIIHFAWSPPAVGFMLAAEKQGYWPPLGISGNHFAAEALGEFIGDYPLKGMWTITTFKVWSENSEYLAVLDKYAPETKLKVHHITQSGYAGARIFIEAAKKVGPDLTRQAMIDAFESQPWDAGPGLGVTFTWGPSGDARDNGTEAIAHDNLRCEYQFKYNASKASDELNVWVPAPEQYEICDDID
jgi:ABC-type branched-subunit amino acid transport system substrate-binding protein